MKKVINFLKDKKYQFLSALFLVITPITSSFAADEVGVDTATLTTTLTGVAGNMIDVLSQIAPIAIKVTCAFLVWKYGVKFFRGLVH